MVHMNSKYILTGIIIIISMVVNSGCISQVQEPTPIPIPAVPDSRNYMDIPDEACAECHINVFNLVSLEGGRHDKGCTFCHVQHGIIPRCTGCHELVHGTQLKNCKDCHDEHAPLSIISSPTFELSCARCHPSQIEEFSDYPGRHDKLKCLYCHPTHRHIQACINCHAPHGPELRYEDCLDCHPAHLPQEIDYPEYIASGTCAFCHEAVSDALEQGGTKHTALKCSYCHPVHEQIPECHDCHLPHTPDMTNEDCTGCHPAHDPLDMEFPAVPQRGTCAICHKDIDVELRGSGTEHDDLGCIYCHPKHRYLPTCESCHGLPHQKFVHEDYPVCEQCHIAAHDVKNIVFTR